MASKRPNFLVIVADDLGFSDISPYGGEINTPVLKKLSKDGIRMTNFHTASACSPTRSMLFSGTDNHIAGLGRMMEHMRHFGDYFKDKPGYEGYLNWRVAALSEILQDNGYHTIMSGKWHLGLSKELAPCSRGFTKSFSFLPGSGNHHAYEPQLDDDEFKIPCLNTEGHWMDGDKFINHRTDLPKDVYSTRYFTDRMIKFLEEMNEKEKDEPFAYLPFTAPHWPLQAPREVVEKYAGKYDDGPDALTQHRLQRLVELGLVDKGIEPAPPTGVLGKDWKDLSDLERKESARKMELFAAMVELIDENIGRVIDHLESTGELDTFVLFMSDNGAEGVALEAIPMMSGETTFAGVIQKYYDNSLNNIGEKSSFAWYGARWACAATALSRGSKCWITEGGIRCPCLIRYPPFQAKDEAITHRFTTVMDILPTILEMAQVQHPGTSFRGREVVIPRGKSWVSQLSSPDYAAADSTVHGEDVHVHGWELFGLRAIREGKRKAVWLNKPRGKDDWELYDVEKDPAEMNDVSDKEPEVMRRLVNHWERYYAETGMTQTPEFPITKA
ncbi:putative sulfatase [Colletotrichum aenigma]|uniref:putative sulfatase n=1 Tax=Colletotrichum aenigma TaxID=1215731 RepID=UPI001872554C|nr:putative sulfatase [Colletotrichum aenigma]KAF5525332.1 putative sulfatase [Colletotrichum aenigma]